MQQSDFVRCVEELDTLARACKPVVAGRPGYQVVSSDAATTVVAD